MSSRAINICCARVILSRHSAMVMFFYMRLEKHVCNAMFRGLLLHEHGSNIVRIFFKHSLGTVRTRFEHGSDLSSNLVRTKFEHSSDTVRR